MTLIELARKLRPLIEQASQSLSDADALEAPQLFPAWKAGMTAEADKKYNYNGVLYKCLQTHITQADWTPDVAVSLFAVVLIPDPSVIPDWVQPDSTNPYQLGDKVKHNGKTWVCTQVDGAGNNIWEPGIYGWEVIS